MKVIELRNKVESRLGLVHRPHDDTLIRSVITDHVRSLTRHYLTEIEPLTITTSSGVGTYELTPASGRDVFKIERITFPSTWTDKLTPAEHPILEEYKRQEANDEMETFSDQPEYWSVYTGASGKKVLELFKASTVAASLTISADVSFMPNKAVFDDADDIMISAELYNVLLYEVLMDVCASLEKDPRTWLALAQEERRIYEKDAMRSQHARNPTIDVRWYPTG